MKKLSLKIILWFVVSTLYILPVCQALNQKSLKEESNKEILRSKTDLENTVVKTLNACVKIFDISSGHKGSGFSHKSGIILTAFHVIEKSEDRNLIVIFYNGRITRVKRHKVSKLYDLAALYVRNPSPYGLNISKRSSFSIGQQIATLGFPVGYNGVKPLLSVGYIAGIETETSGTLKKKFLLNAAFNNGNSGGPLIDVKSGEVIGVVVSKLAPIPDYILLALKAMEDNKWGLLYTKTLPSGEKVTVPQSQILADILHYLRRQTQLVIGKAIVPNDVRKFLLSIGIEP